jgi:hypothetical protein
MTQKDKIITKLGDGLWHCSRELIEQYSVDYRSVINKLRKAGFEIEGCNCNLHHHEGKMNMWRLTKIPENQFNTKPQIKFQYQKSGNQIVKQGVMF